MSTTATTPPTTGGTPAVTPATRTSPFISKPKLLFWGFLFAILVVAYFTFQQKINKLFESNKTTTENVVEHEEESLPFTPDKVYTVYLKITDSIGLWHHDDYRLCVLTGGTAENPIPYRVKEGDNGEWRIFGNGNEDFHAPKIQRTWLSGTDSTNSTRIWYYYKHKNSLVTP